MTLRATITIVGSYSNGTLILIQRTAETPDDLMDAIYDVSLDPDIRQALNNEVLMRENAS